MRRGSSGAGSSAPGAQPTSPPPWRAAAVPWAGPPSPVRVGGGARRHPTHAGRAAGRGGSHDPPPQAGPPLPGIIGGGPKTLARLSSVRAGRRQAACRGGEGAAAVLPARGPPPSNSTLHDEPAHRCGARGTQIYQSAPRFALFWVVPWPSPTECELFNVLNRWERVECTVEHFPYRLSLGTWSASGVVCIASAQLSRLHLPCGNGRPFCAHQTGGKEDRVT